jgi:hypothetical protein
MARRLERRGLVIASIAWTLTAGTTASAATPSLFCHQVDAVTAPVSVPGIELVDRFGTTDTAIQRTVHLCRAAVVDGTPSAVPDFEAATYELASGTPRVSATAGDFRATTSITHTSILPLYADLLMTTATIADGSPPDEQAPFAAWTCYRLQYPAFPNPYIPIADPFRPDPKIVKIRKPRLLCMPSQLNGVPSPDPDAMMICYRQVSRLPAPPQPTVPDVVVDTPFATEVLDVNKDDLVCVPATIESAPAGSAGERVPATAPAVPFDAAD